VAKKTTEKVDELTRASIEGLGYELVDIEFIKEQGEWVLTFYIDKDGGVTIDDCERVSRLVDPLLDEGDPIEQKYFLSVSSLGLDRPLKKTRDFERNLGKEVEVKLYAPLNGKKEYIGMLTAFDEIGFEIEEKTGIIRFENKAVALVRPHLVF